MTLVLLAGSGSFGTMAEAATTTTTSPLFEQLTSTRLYLANTKISPRVDSWPVLDDIATTPQLLSLTTPAAPTNASVWALVPGKLFVVDAGGRTRAVSVSGGGLPSGGAVRGATCGADSGILVVASAEEVVVLSCDADEDAAVCKTVQQIALPPSSQHGGAAAPAVACTRTGSGILWPWVAPARAGCVYAIELATGRVIKMDDAIAHGNVTALAVSAADAPFRLAVGTEDAVFYGFNATALTFDHHVDVGDLVDAPAQALAFNGTDLWVGHEWCLNVIRGDTGWVDRVSGAQGLPAGNITGLASSGRFLWIGTTMGAARYAPNDRPNDRWRFFGGDRWVPGLGTPVASIVLGDRGVWVATEGAGIAYIAATRTAFAAKAAAYLRDDVPRLDRYGWVAAAGLARYGDAASAQPRDGDNDGLWTGMLVAALSFEYAVARDEGVRAAAWRHFRAVEFLHNVTGGEGFIARTAVRCGEPHQHGDGTICPAGSPITCGWVNSPSRFRRALSHIGR